MRRRIEADQMAVDAKHRRAQLGRILEEGKTVTVTNPHGGMWAGRIIGIADGPAMLLERADGVRVMLPQCFAVEQQDGE